MKDNKKMIVVGVLGLVSAGAISFINARNKKKKRENEINQVIDDLREIFDSNLDTLSEISDLTDDLLDEDETDKDYLKESDFMKLAYEQIKTNAELQSEIRDVKEEIISLYTHLEALSDKEESEM